MSCSPVRRCTTARAQRALRTMSSIAGVTACCRPMSNGAQCDAADDGVALSAARCASASRQWSRLPSVGARGGSRAHTGPTAARRDVTFSGSWRAVASNEHGVRSQDAQRMVRARLAVRVAARRSVASQEACGCRGPRRFVRNCTQVQARHPPRASCAKVDHPVGRPYRLSAR